jgi:8-oxo-dGTP pyrophosphatase MutT (NUDIX family)
VGADQLFAQIVLDLAIRLEAIIPCDQYEEMYRSDNALDTYHHLLNLCQHIHYLSDEACSEEAFLHAGRWIVDHSNMLILIWNGRPPMGRGGTGDIATYARLKNLPYVHLHTLKHTIKQYGQIADSSPLTTHTAPKREFTTAKRTVYQGSVLAVNQYRLRMPTGEEIVRDIVERPESVLILPIGQQQTVLLIEEYDLGAGAWQLKLPGGKVHDATPDGLRMQAEIELREELGYRAGKLKKLINFYSHPGYTAHKVHLFVAEELEWDPLEMEEQEEVHVQTLKLEDALAATKIDYRCDPEAALALWLYAGHIPN